MPHASAQDIAKAALALADAYERTTFLDQTCGDAELRQEVDVLLTVLSPTFIPALGESVGSQVGPYTLMAVLGAGGMGVVYRAQQERPVKRTVALKIIKPGLDTEQVIARFYSERQALAPMDHPNIAKVLDAGATAAGRPYFVMELVDGEPITAFCDSRRLTIRERIEVFLPVCQAIQHAHQKGIIHRDIKPSNMLVTVYDQKPVPKVIDFGIAKATAQPFGAISESTQAGSVVGTLEYMSPEQAEGALDLDTRSDIYSLGAVLYQLVTGTTPLGIGRVAGAGYSTVLRHIGEEQVPLPSIRVTASRETLTQVAADRRADPAKLSSVVRGELDWIIMKALEKERSRRYVSANDLLRDLERYLHGEPVDAGPPSATYRLRKLAYKHRALLSTAVAFVVLLIGAAVVSTWQAMRANRERDRAVAALQDANAERLAAYAMEGLTEDPERSIILAMHAVDATLRAGRAATPNAQSALHSALRSSHVRVSLLGHKDSVQTVDVSPDGKRVVTGSEDGTAGLWDAQTGKRLHTLADHKDWVWGVAFSPDGKYVATGSTDRTAKLWDVETGRSLLTFRGHEHSVGSVAFSPDGRRLATASVDQTARLWDSSTGQPLLTLRGHRHPVNSVRFSPAGDRVVTIDREGSVRTWNSSTGKTLLDVSSGPDRCHKATFSPDGERLALACLTGLQMWDSRTGRRLTTIPVSTDQLVLSVAFRRDGKILATGTTRGTAQLWDVATGRELLSIQAHKKLVTSVAFASDGKYIVTGSSDHTARVWDIGPGEELPGIPGGGDARRQIAFSPDGNYVAATHAETAARVWRIPGGSLRFELRGHQRRVTGVSFSPDGKLIATSSFDATAKLWDATTGEQSLTLRGHPRGVWSTAFSPDGRVLATAGLTGMVKTWDVNTGKDLLTIRLKEGFVASVAFSGDGRWLATALGEGTAQLWDVQSGKEVMTLRGHKSPIQELAFSPDGKNLVTASEDKTAKLWEIKTGRELLTLAGHEDAVYDVAFSRLGNRIATASTDRTARIWDVATGIELVVLRLNGLRLTSLAYSPDDKRLAIADENGGIHFVLLDIQDLLALARKRVTRPLTSQECRSYFGSDACPALP